MIEKLFQKVRNLEFEPKRTLKEITNIIYVFITYLEYRLLCFHCLIWNVRQLSLAVASVALGKGGLNLPSHAVENSPSHQAMDQSPPSISPIATEILLRFLRRNKWFPGQKGEQLILQSHVFYNYMNKSNIRFILWIFPSNTNGSFPGLREGNGQRRD